MCNTYMLHGHMLKSATSDYDQRQMIVFRPISIEARSWSCNKKVYVKVMKETSE